MPSDLLLAQTEDGGKKQKDLEKVLTETSTSPPPPSDALIDFQDDLKKALPSNSKAEVRDKGKGKTAGDDSDGDEFVDAEG